MPLVLNHSVNEAVVHAHSPRREVSQRPIFDGDGAAQGEPVIQADLTMWMRCVMSTS
jgi:hypothetical protein